MLGYYLCSIFNFTHFRQELRRYCLRQLWHSDTTVIYYSKGQVANKNIRFTIDLDSDQYEFLKNFSEEHGITSSIVLRALLYVLEIDETFATRVVEEFFDDNEEDAPKSEKKTKKSA